VLRRIAAGRSNREVAGELAPSLRTGERHLTNLDGVIGAGSRADAAVVAPRRGPAAPAPGPGDGGAAISPAVGEVAARSR
jgi:hypothetical protein